MSRLLSNYLTKMCSICVVASRWARGQGQSSTALKTFPGKKKNCVGQTVTKMKTNHCSKRWINCSLMCISHRWTPEQGIHNSKTVSCTSHIHRQDQAFTISEQIQWPNQHQVMSTSNLQPGIQNLHPSINTAQGQTIQVQIVWATDGDVSDPSPLTSLLKPSTAAQAVLPVLLPRQLRF